MDFGTVLVAYDGSDFAKKALHVACGLAEKGSARDIHVLKILEPYIPYYSAEVAVAMPFEINPIVVTEEDCRALEDEIETLLGECPISASTEIQVGNPKDVISDTAEERSCGLIIMGSRGLGPVRGLLGSVSYGVLSHSKVPVLIIK